MPDEAVTSALRSRALTTTASELGMTVPTSGSGVWGVIMDVTFDEGGSYTTVALADGNASIYLGEQSGVIGGISHEDVRKAAAAAVAAAESVTSDFQKGRVSALPKPEFVRFYLRSRNGLLISAEIEEAELGEGNHVLSRLFFAMHDVIGKLRTVEEKGRADA
jgi:hypothetical protein